MGAPAQIKFRIKVLLFSKINPEEVNTPQAAMRMNLGP
jgi:hypothetical protein